MTQDLWIALGCGAAAFCGIEALLYCVRAAKYKSAMQSLTRAKQEAHEISELPLSNPHPLVQVSQNGDIIFANPAALALFPDIKTQGLSHPILRDVTQFKSREIAYEDKTYQQTITATRVKNEDAFIVYCHDITERKLYERELQHAQKQAETSRIAAEKAKEARGQFLANMSHELRTPMNGIIGLSDILAESGLEGEKQDLIEAVNSSARNLLNLLNDILDFSKIEAGELTIESIPFDLRKIIRQIESLQGPMAVQKGLAFETKIAPHIPAYLKGDPSRLQQILNNLISNALKFTHLGGVTLEVGGQRAQGNDKNFAAIISVRDTGIGIPRDKQASIFEKFQQADASTARKYGGTGLGLAITKDLVMLMNGTISIESEQGAGTTFTITMTLPIADQASMTEHEEDTGARRAGINTKARMMIVDDHPINLLFLRQTLARIGFEHFDEAASAREALALFEQNTYDVIIMDCQMPDMDGFEATRKIRAIEKAQTAPIIIAATADAMKGAQEKCIAAGMDDYISKPIDKHKLKTMLESWIPGNEDQIRTQLEQEEKPIENLAPAQKSQTLDWQRLHDFTNGDPEIEREILTMFIENLKNDIAALQKSFDEENYEDWNAWVHKLYGACSHVGAYALAEICDQAQSLPHDQTGDIERLHASVLYEYRKIEKDRISNL